eukprot:s2220_g6.t1
MAPPLVPDTGRPAEPAGISRRGAEEHPEDDPTQKESSEEKPGENETLEGRQHAPGLFRAARRVKFSKTAVLNGAGAVPKAKGDRVLQRFISIFVPLNSVSRKIEGYEATLPYVGQVSLSLIPNECEMVVDSEDMTSAFNLFRMPAGWRGLFVYEKTVPARCIGLDGDAPTYVALRTVPMGWVSAVGALQAAIRHLAFNIARLPCEAEIPKWKAIPDDERLLLYLDSVDQLRLVSKTMAKVMEGEASPEHIRFKDACVANGLRTNGKDPVRIAGWFAPGRRAEIGRRGFHLAAGQDEDVAGMGSSSGLRNCWTAGVCSSLQAPVLPVQRQCWQNRPTPKVVTDMVCMVGLLPLAFTHVSTHIYEIERHRCISNGGRPVHSREVEEEPRPTRSTEYHLRQLSARHGGTDW